MQDDKNNGPNHRGWQMQDGVFFSSIYVSVILYKQSLLVLEITAIPAKPQITNMIDNKKTINKLNKCPCLTVGILV